VQSPLKLIIGNKNYSSWSLRPWLVLRHSQIPFEEETVLLDTPDTRSRLLRFSGSAKVPVLIHRDIKIWDSLAIIEYLAEQFPECSIWPGSPVVRAEARSASAEMHSGFLALRTAMPLNCRARGRKVEINEALRSDIRRVIEFWSDLRTRFAAVGPWLFGEFTAADAMYAPVVLRFVTYGVEVEEPARSFVEAILESVAVRDWLSAARAEPEIIPSGEAG